MMIRTKPPTHTPTIKPMFMSFGKIQFFPKVVSMFSSIVEVGQAEVEVDDPEVEVGEREVEVGEREVEVGEAEVEVDDPEVEVDDPEAEVDELEVEVSEPEVEVGEPEVQVSDPSPSSELVSTAVAAAVLAALQLKGTQGTQISFESFPIAQNGNTVTPPILQSFAPPDPINASSGSLLVKVKLSD